MLKHRKTPLYQRPPFVQPRKSHKKRNALIGMAGTAAAVAIAGVIEHRRLGQ